jgi:hypothetical protein
MKTKEFFDIALPKWPAFVVVGKPVTKEQAMEILIRTDSLCFSSNDREFDRELKESLFEVKIEKSGFQTEDDAIKDLLGIKEEDPLGWKKLWDYKDKRREEAGALPLVYLGNSQIVSSWIVGPHGWCDWRGNIGCNNYNIGKWPSVERVYEEWELIAKTFPFLELTCQLMGHEAGYGPEDGEDIPVIEFRIKNGKVKMANPDKAIKNTHFGTEDIMERFGNPRAERGCTIEMFKKALEHTKLSIAEPKIETDVTSK